MGESARAFMDLFLWKAGNEGPEAEPAVAPCFLTTALFHPRFTGIPVECESAALRGEGVWDLCEVRHAPGWQCWLLPWRPPAPSFLPWSVHPPGLRAPSTGRKSSELLERAQLSAVSRVSEAPSKEEGK